LLAKLSYYTS
ncbi:hypothetical protein PENANT_c250G10256, partial [Penicillium antarcticum]